VPPFGWALIPPKNLEDSFLRASVVRTRMAIRAKGDEILFLIFSCVTAKLLVMDF